LSEKELNQEHDNEIIRPSELILLENTAEDIEEIPNERQSPTNSLRAA
jgi:hypothetical protein